MYNGSNEIEILKYTPHNRIEYVWRENIDGELIKTNITMRKPPHNFTIMKGSAYCIFSREFIHYVLDNRHAIDLISWSNGTYSPDELYFFLNFIFKFFMENLCERSIDQRSKKKTIIIFFAIIIVFLEKFMVPIQK
jgi:hypothetical protein